MDIWENPISPFNMKDRASTLKGQRYMLTFISKRRAVNTSVLRRVDFGNTLNWIGHSPYSNPVMAAVFRFSCLNVT